MPRVFITFEDLYQEIAELARENSVSSQADWKTLVDEIVDGYLDMGELDSNQDIEGYKTSLSPLWLRFKKEAKEEELNPEEEVIPERYQKDVNDEFDVVEDFSDTVKKEEEGF